MIARINRRETIALLGGAAATWPLTARAQQGDRVRRIGVLMPNDENDPSSKTSLSAFTQALADLGWTDGRNLRMDLRWGGGDINRIREVAHELVGLRPDIIVTNGGTATAALQRQTRTIPIVFASGTDPVASGIVERLDRPGGNITGFANLEATLGGKWLELLSEIAPGRKRAAIMFNPETAPVSTIMPSFETAARSLNVLPIIAPVRSNPEIETAIIALGREPGGGLVATADPFMFVHRAPVILAAVERRGRLMLFQGSIGPLALAALIASLGGAWAAEETKYPNWKGRWARNNVPAVYSLSYYAREGGLLSYGRHCRQLASCCLLC
jgi:putative ABC transport system substrate-binding protein